MSVFMVTISICSFLSSWNGILLVLSCLDYALGLCSEEHNQYSSYVDKFHKIRKEVKGAVEGVVDLPKKASFSKSWDQIDSNHKEYHAHIVRTKHQGCYYHYVLANLCSGEIVLIMDYKMKVELGLRTLENQREWYGKRGISLHGFLIIAQVPVNSFLVPFLTFFDFAVKCLFTCTLCLIVHASHFGFVNFCISLICLFDLI